MRTVLRIGTLAAALVLLVALALPASAEHVHWLRTPGTLVQDIGSGQTSIDETEHGGYHRFHVNVHTGAAGTTLNSKTPVEIGRS